MPQPLISKKPIITVTNPKSPISEAYRLLRTNIDFSAIDEQLKILMITSAEQGEGKSTTATNLAVVFAQSDKKVLLMDADMRKPTMHHMFNKSNRWGLTTLLSGQTTLKEVIKETNIPNLNLITSGGVPPNPSEMLASNKMSSILEELKELYDIVVVDTPPALAVTDAQILASKCDGVILIINSGKLKREIAIKLKASLEYVKARILGVVLNNMDRKSTDSYYYYYGAKEEN